MRIIALMPVRNEAWIIERTLSVLSTFCDRIIVADQHSMDGTAEILRKFAPKVAVIDNPSLIHSTRIRWRLLETAREYEGDNFLIFSDADEIFTANIKDGEIMQQLVDVPAGTGVTIPWIQLWRSPHHWRNDASVWTGNYMTIGFRDDRQAQYGPILEPNDHNPRIPEPKCVERLDHIKLLHFQFILFDRMHAKQCWYRAQELMELGQDQAKKINFGYRITRDERQVRLSPIDPEWVAGWQELGIDLEHFEEEPLYWYNVEVLRHFAEKGPAFFAPLDLWDVDWEQKRRMALNHGYEGIPGDPIIDPRTWEQKLYHAYLARFQRNPFWRDPMDPIRLAGFGLKKLAKGLGFKLKHLELLGALVADRHTDQK